MLKLSTTIWEPIPRDEIPGLYAEKLRIFRPFAVIVMALAALLGIGLWGWDFAVDPLGAPNTLPYRLAEIPALGLFPLYLYFNLWPRFRTFAFVLSMTVSQALMFPIFELLQDGPLIGSGAFLFWYIFVPLAGVGLTLKDSLYAMLGLSVAPLLWNALGLLAHFQTDVFILYMWPAGFVVSAVLVANNHFMLQMIRSQKLLSLAKEEAEHMARTDVMTGMNNRRAFLELGGAAFQNAKRYGHPLSVVLLDLDHFKRINDTHGHAAGDAVIVMTAELINLCVRESDITGRFGGEEFVLLLSETDLTHAVEMAERMRATVSATLLDEKTGFTASFGVVQLSAGCDNLETLVAQADQALYEAKEGGRNRVVANTSLH